MKVPFVSFLPMEKELGKEIKLAFERVYSRSWYILGEEDQAFEKSFASYVGVNNCIGVGNGLDALILSLRALKIGTGDEVIVPSNTYIASVLAISYVGATPVLVDPDINTLKLLLLQVLRLLCRFICMDRPVIWIPSWILQANMDYLL